MFFVILFGSIAIGSALGLVAVHILEQDTDFEDIHILKEIFKKR